MDRGMEQYNARVDLAQALCRGFAAMRGAVVDAPEQAFSRAIGLLRQHLIHQATERLDTGLRFTTSHHVPPAHVPGSQILQGTFPFVLVLDTSGVAWSRRTGWVAPEACLNARFFIGTEDVVLGTQGAALPLARIQIQNGARLLGKVRITGKDPVLVAPGLERISVQDPPHGTATNRLAQHFVSL